MQNLQTAGTAATTYVQHHDHTPRKLEAGLGLKFPFDHPSNELKTDLPKLYAGRYRDDGTDYTFDFYVRSSFSPPHLFINIAIKRCNYARPPPAAPAPCPRMPWTEDQIQVGVASDESVILEYMLDDWHRPGLLRVGHETFR